MQAKCRRFFGNRFKSGWLQLVKRLLTYYFVFDLKYIYRVLGALTRLNLSQLCLLNFLTLIMYTIKYFNRIV